MTLDAPLDPDRAQLPEALLASYPFELWLGYGTTSVVYLARQANLGRRVVVKVLTYFDAEMEERFLREARVLSSLRHPGIVQLLDFGRAGNRLYMTYSYEQGRPLNALLEERPAMPWRQAAQLGLEIASALAEIHGKGIVHRDVKPGNIIVASEGAAKLLDFGFSRVPHSTLTTPGEYIGTPAYSAPEHCHSGHCDALSDLYSLGVVLYDMLTGGNPFRGPTVADTLQRQLLLIVEQFPPSAPESPRELRVLVLEMLAKSPGDRPASAALVVKRLVAILGASEARPQLPALLRSPAPTARAATTDRIRLEAPSSPEVAAASRPSRLALTLFCLAAVVLAVRFAAVRRAAPAKGAPPATAGSKLPSAEAAPKSVALERVEAIRAARLSPDELDAYRRALAAAVCEASRLPRPEGARALAEKIRSHPVSKRLLGFLPALAGGEPDGLRLGLADRRSLVELEQGFHEMGHAADCARCWDTELRSLDELAPAGMSSLASEGALGPSLDQIDCLAAGAWKELPAVGEDCPSGQPSAVATFSVELPPAIRAGRVWLDLRAQYESPWRFTAVAVHGRPGDLEAPLSQTFYVRRWGAQTTESPRFILRLDPSFLLCGKLSFALSSGCWPDPSPEAAAASRCRIGPAKLLLLR